MKLRLAALLALTLARRLPPRRRHHAENGGGIYAVRSACPLVGVPAGTGDITLFNPPDSTDAARDRRDRDDHQRSRDLRRDRRPTSSRPRPSTSSRSRRDAGPARQVVLPYFDVALQGGSQVVAKRVGQVALNFAAGSQRA